MSLQSWYLARRASIQFAAVLIGVAVANHDMPDWYIIALKDCELSRE